MQHRTPPARDHDLLFLFFVVGALAGLVGLQGVIPFGKGFEMCALARNLAAHGSFANPFDILDTGSSAANPPFYPLILAGYTWLFRNPGAIFLAAVVGNLVANAFTASWLLPVSKTFFGDVRPGMVASLLWMAAIEIMPAWDTGFTVALLLLFIRVATRVFLSEGSWRTAALAGSLAGALFLLNPSTILICLPWVACLLVANPASRRRSVRRVVLLITVLGVFVFGWMLRNRLVLGTFVTRTNLGMTLYASNNDCARPALSEEIQNDCYQSHHPDTSLTQARQLMSVGEVAYDRMRVADSKAWIRSHPAAFLELSMARLRNFWFPPFEDHPFKIGVLWLATALSIPGLVWMAWNRERSVLYIVVVLFFYPLMYYVVVSDVRYRYPVLWLSLLPVGYLLRNLVPIRFSAPESRS